MVKIGKLRGELKSVGVLAGRLSVKAKLSGVIKGKDVLIGQIRALPYSTDDYATDSDIDRLFVEVK